MRVAGGGQCVGHEVGLDDVVGVVLGPAGPQGWPGRAGLRFGPVSVEADGFAWRAEETAIEVPLRWPEAMAGAVSAVVIGARFRTKLGYRLVSPDL